MNLYKKITDVIAKIAAWIAMLAVIVIVFFIVSELIRRNIFNKSFRPTIEICGISFLWMAFMGIIPLYNENGLMRLDFLISRTKGMLFEILYLINKIFSFGLGIIMVVAYNYQYPYVSRSEEHTVQYIPMAIAGAFIAVKALWEIIEWFIRVVGKKGREEAGA